MRGAILAGSAAATGFLYRKLNPPPAVVEERPRIAGLVKPPSVEAIRNGFKVNEPLTSFEDITNYNTFYKCDMNKLALAVLPPGFLTPPHTLQLVALLPPPTPSD